MLAVPKRAAAGTPEVAAGGAAVICFRRTSTSWLEVDEDNAPHNEAPANQALPLLVNGARAKRGVRRAAKTAGKPKT
jgi:hypothetical protein